MNGTLSGPVAQEEVVKVGDLGRFSMATIYEALVNYDGAAVNRGGRETRPEAGGNVEDSDCSWTDEEECGTFYCDIRHQLNDFILSPERATMTTGVLSRHQRRFVHATAQIMQLGHASLGAHGKNRRMVVFKKDTAMAGEPLTLHASTSSDRSEEKELEISANAAVPCKRRRIQRATAGFPCRYERCEKAFDRASERTKHEQAHQPEYRNRYQCTHCIKGFRYPKDLRRHQKIHDDADTNVGAPASNSSNTSKLTSESRVSSETSLTFSSNTVSNDVSPQLAALGMGGDAIPDLEPLVLDESARTLYGGAADDDLQLHFDEFLNFGFDENDGFEDDLLEMARTRK
ncbi:hypothetical protein LTR37_018666 [Vermiconidia calcicola]|uniref:Uncharacterized protein n=1 Tax=Vermiconidia calcicola TaxID=1690605 RepID=A0ACC3MGD6_9PEZI|nr:hypothetical protein LTR37_018666 [Vermiconidia calcicola]